MEKWGLTYDDLVLSKIVCLHGLSLSQALSFLLKNKSRYVKITFVPYKEFIESSLDKLFVNYENLCKCDTVVIIDTCNNNTVEIQWIKITISIMYFALRWMISDERYVKDETNNIESFHDYFANYTIDGYFGEKWITSASWYINLGCNPLSNDNFERWLPRLYGNDLVDSYDRRAGLFCDDKTYIEIDEEYMKKITLITDKLNSEDQMSYKLLSFLRLYYEILCNFKNPDYTTITYCTIFEILLLKKDESNQRKKVAARAACVTCDKLDIKYKKFVANQVYYFYKYRNAIIHDGKDLIDFDNEMVFNSVLYGMKSIVFSIFKCILVNNIKTHDDLMKIIEDNKQQDGLCEAFDYIDLNDFQNNPDKINPIIFQD